MLQTWFRDLTSERTVGTQDETPRCQEGFPEATLQVNSRGPPRGTHLGLQTRVSHSPCRSSLYQILVTPLHRLSVKVLVSMESKQGKKVEGPSGNVVTLSTSNFSSDTPFNPSPHTLHPARGWAGSLSLQEFPLGHPPSTALS